jgi:hypothetical protein
MMSFLVTCHIHQRNLCHCDCASADDAGHHRPTHADVVVDLRRMSTSVTTQWSMMTSAKKMQKLMQKMVGGKKIPCCAIAGLCTRDVLRLIVS